MTFQEIINLHPNPSDLNHDLLLRCIEECLDCAASCTACADACLGESDLEELRRCIRLNLDCADACEATGRIVTRQTSPDLRGLSTLQAGVRRAGRRDRLTRQWRLDPTSELPLPTLRRASSFGRPTRCSRV